MNSRFLEKFIYIILLCLPVYLIRFSIFQIPFTFLEVLILLLFIIFLIHFKAKFSLGSYKYIILSFILISLFASINAVDQIKAFGLFKAYIIEPILFFIVLINVRPNFSKVIKSLGMGALFVSLIGLIQYIFGYGIPSPWNIRGAEFRITSVFEYPNAVGLYLTPIIILFLGNIILLKKDKYFSLSVIIFSVFSIAVAATQGAVVAVLMALFFLGFFTKYKKYFISLFIVCIVISLIVPGIREIILFKDTSGDVRLALWQGTVNLIKDRPLIGAGLASFPEIYAEYKLDKHVELLLYPHNIFLNFWVEFGLLGLIWLFWVLINFFKTCFKYYKPITITLCATMIGILIYGLVDVPYFKNDLATIFWTILGLMEITNSSH
ncbi:MAG: O-antigen ligase family protein [Patescibacteria group bacterium]